ncbi:MAG: SAM-dependent methyltransferase [Dactylosporangium sp.]|nr:SAM-dependent methyltransferase [Dactylosporangium sp.]NNJ60876.1 SAM-dependent methyltransferase [Dactylosporangium sp.]
MPESLEAALADLRALLLDPDHLVRAVASGRRRGAKPSAARVELRPVSIKTGRRLQVVRDDGARPSMINVSWGRDAEAAVNALLAEPFGSWMVARTTETVQLRVTKRGLAQVHRAPVTRAAQPVAEHDRVPQHLLGPDDPLFDLIGGGAAKRRQVDAFLRALVSTLGSGDLPRPLRVADLGCGNAYLTFAAFRYLTSRGLDARVTGVDIRDDQRQRNTALAERLGCGDRVRFVAGTIAEAGIDAPPDIVLALHACDTATDEALARAVGWGSRWVLAAPCCHHEIAAQLRDGVPRPGAGGALLRDGILRERFAEVLTDAMRAALLRSWGYKVEVVEFIDSEHTARNVLLRARYTGHAGPADEYSQLAEAWNVTSSLARLR